MLPNEGEHGTETDRQTNSSAIETDRPTEPLKEILKEGMTKLWPEKKGRGL